MCMAAAVDRWTLLSSCFVLLVLQFGAAIPLASFVTVPVPLWIFASLLLLSSCWQVAALRSF